MIIDKHIIIQALKTEPLTYGAWATSTTFSGCKVCAVGAVISQAYRPEFTEDPLYVYARVDDQFNRICGQVTDQMFGADCVAPEGNYLSALSIVWEYLNRHNDTTTEELRPDIIAWAEDNIPEDYTVKIEV